MPNATNTAFGAHEENAETSPLASEVNSNERASDTSSFEHEPAVLDNTDAPDKADGSIFVAGIGASAGGLEAIEELIRYVPTANVAYIVVQHLAPDHESLLAHLLGRSRRMPVVTATDGMPLERGHVYVIPPNADIAVTRGVIRLATPPPGQRPHLPVDYLFRSLAADQGHSAIGVVLSGTGTDGTLGLKAIKAAGGFTFCQDPSTAKYDGMPRSALDPMELGREIAFFAGEHAAQRFPKRSR